MSKKRGLGRGLDALIPSGGKEETDLVELPLAEIQPNPRQARKNFDEEAISELAASIEQHGLIQPVIVRRSASGSGYELVAGERRYRAYRRLGRATIPAIIRDLGDFESTAALLIENVQRQDLSSLEEAQAYRRLIEEFGLTQEEVARQVGKSRTAITNSLRLLSLPEKVLALLGAGAITAGHARALAALEDEGLMERLALKAAEKGLSVREVEAEVKRWNALRQQDAAARRAIDRLLREWARGLSRNLGTGVKIRGTRTEGRVEIKYKSEEELRRVLAALGLKE